MNKAPRIINKEADLKFGELAKKYGYDPDDLWVGRYVSYVWERNAFLFSSITEKLENKCVLEFGCNFGASAIVLAALGAEVVAIDVDMEYIKLATLNARRYGVDNRILFTNVPDTRKLPFGNETFDYVNCSSVIEYVPSNQLIAVEREIDRVLMRSGILTVLGTSNRLWPKEVHSQRWLVNYIPRFIDRLIFRGHELQRGVFPWEILRVFNSDHYQNLDLNDRAELYLTCHENAGTSPFKLFMLKFSNNLLRPLGITAGMLTPSIAISLKKL